MEKNFAEPSHKDLFAKTIHRIEDCFSCRYEYAGEENNSMTLNFCLAQNLGLIKLKFRIFNMDKDTCGFDVVAELDGRSSIISTVLWSEFDPDNDDEDLLLSKIQAGIFAFAEKWIEIKDFTNLMSWIKTTGYNSTLLKKIKTISEKIL